MSDHDESDKSTTEEVETSGPEQQVHVTAGDKVVVRGDDQDVDVVRDIIMWRRKRMSGLLLVVATAVWVLLQVYDLKFLPLAAWLAMLSTTLLFLYGSLLRLLRKEAANMGKWEMTEERAKDMADRTRRMMEKGIRWMFHVSCEREWYAFVGVVSGLLLLAYLGHHFDLLTLVYSATLTGMTVPVIYEKKEDDINAYGDRLRLHLRTLHHKLDDKVFSKWKSGGTTGHPKKERKVE